MSVQFPITVCVAGSNGCHEIFLTKSSVPIGDLTRNIIDLVRGSANCVDFMKSMQINDSKAILAVKDIAVHWSTVGRDDIFPSRTVLSSHNCHAVLRLLELGAGKDVMEVTIAPLERESKEAREAREAKEATEAKERREARGSIAPTPP